MMMDLDNAIKHAEEVAEENGNRAKRIRANMKSEIALSNADECEACADEYRQLAGWLKELKQLREQTRWIPCSERLPEDYQRVLVTIVNYNEDKVVRVAEYSRRTFKIKENHEHWQVGEKGLLAWRPLQEPYMWEKESEDD